MAAYLDTLVRNPVFLGINSGWFSGMLVMKKLADGGLKSLIGALGVSTRRDQLRILHALNKLDARLDDIEHVLSTIRRDARADATGRRESFPGDGKGAVRNGQETTAPGSAPAPC